MSDNICVVSERSGKLFRAKKENFDVKEGDYVIIDSELGGELAVVKNISRKICESPKFSKDIVKIVSIATEEDIKKFSWLGKKEQKAFAFCLDRIKARKLPMKLVRVRYFFNEKKGIFYCSYLLII